MGNASRKVTEIRDAYIRNRDNYKERKDQNFDRHVRKIEHHPIVKEIRRMLAEMYGTFVLTFIIALGAMMEVLTNGRVNNTGLTLAAGLVLAALIFSASQVSGAHFNPAITWAFALRGVFSWWRVPLYWISQFIGSLIAGAIIYSVFRKDASVGATLPSDLVTNAEAFYLEAVFTFFFVYTVLGVSQRSRIVGANAAIAIGFMLAAINLVGEAITGTSVNPARSFGPAMIAGGRARHLYWIYVAGPFVGATFATLLAAVFQFKPDASDKEGAKGGGTAQEKEPEEVRDPDANV